MVFDASAKTTGPSLNDCIHPGPSLTEPLLSVLIRFRNNRIAFVADIEKSFLQVLIAEDQRDFVLFLWYKNSHLLNMNNFSEAKLCTYRLCRLLFGVTSSPCSLTAVILKHFNSYKNIDPTFVDNLLRALHIDDLNAGADNVHEAYEFYIKAKKRFATASFNLRKFQSNSVELEDMVADNISLIHLTSEETKVLGVTWNKVTDEFVFNLSDIASITHQPTKRQLLSFIASIYDPMGLLNPFVLKLKELFQRACIDNMWDEMLSEELLRDWRLILDDLTKCWEIRLNRFFGSSESVELHSFCDASLKGFGCCVYVRFAGHNGDVNVSLVTSQSRIAPISKTTIPKLELQSVLFSKCVNNIVQVLSSTYSITGIHLYSDSTIMLSWIHSTKSTVPFVQGRVDVIRDLTLSLEWHHIRGVKNPADVLSRGCNFSSLAANSEWFYGPKFLHHVDIVYDSLGRNVIFDDFDVLSGKDGLEEAPCLLVNTKNDEEFPFVDSLINKFSPYDKLVRVTAYVTRFIKNIKKKAKKEEIVLSVLSTEECQHAEALLIKHVQRKLKSQPNFDQLRKELNLQEIDGMLRCKGRLKNAPIDYETKYPILLPRNESFSTLVVDQTHKNVLYNGMKETVNELRKRFWIPKCRQFVKKIIHKCLLCKRFEGTIRVSTSARFFNFRSLTLE